MEPQEIFSKMDAIRAKADADIQVLRAQLPKEELPRLSFQQIQAIEPLISAGNLLAAIKTLRNLEPMGLKDAKDWIDLLRSCGGKP